MTDYVEQWDMRVTKSNVMLADGVSPSELADSYPDLEPDQIDDLCSEAAMQAIGAGDTLIDMEHFRDAHAELGLGTTDEADERGDKEAATETHDEPHPKPDGGAIEEAAGRGESPSADAGSDVDVREETAEVDDDAPDDEGDGTEGRSGSDADKNGPESPTEMSRAELESEVQSLRSEVDKLQQVANRDVAVLKGALTNLLDVDEFDDLPAAGKEFGDRLGDVEDEVASLDGVIADGGGGKASKVRDIVQMASNRRTDEAVIAMEVSDIVDATGVSRRYANDLIDGSNSLPSEYAWMHERADLTQYGELELDKNAQNKALVIDFAGAQGPKCPVNKFTTGGR
ncbi:DUF433 domain-containing protein [Haloarcula amylovorans]|uniref:hypothetical protein n=1 Tax=Haloarcula amylovorans TaxID=2562280 RepID=UPI00107629CC|nr:hypothetical protein [Halomicroarcula amylolytica]